MRSFIIERLARPGSAGDSATSRAVAAARTLIPAAVLVPLVDWPAAMTVVLTRRTAHLKDHAGQVSFPGGRVEPADSGPVATALREAEEEIGLRPEAVEVVGELDRYETGTGFLVHPVVAIVQAGLPMAPDPFEVEEVFEVPLSVVLEPGNYQRRRRSFQGVEREYYVLQYRHYDIWGATAAMLANLCRRLGGGTGPP